jgi:hypothetical protein
MEGEDIKLTACKVSRLQLAKIKLPKYLGFSAV